MIWQKYSRERFAIGSTWQRRSCSQLTHRYVINFDLTHDLQSQVHDHNHYATFRGHFERVRVGTPFPLSKSCRNALERRRSQCWRLQERIMYGIANHFPGKMPHWIAGFLIYNLKVFPVLIRPDLHGSAASAWSQTSIFAWLASVPIVSVLRNDHWPSNHTWHSICK